MNKSLVDKFFLYFLVVCLCSHFSITAQTVPDDKGYIVSVGDTVPDLTLSMLNGDAILLSELKGKVVVLQFTASWCSVCRKEMPHLENEIWLPNKNKDFILIGVDIDEDAANVAPFIEKMEVTYPVALDSDKNIFYTFAAQKAGVTRNIVINKNGKIAFLTRLFDPVEFNLMKEKIDQLLK